jgi:predicted nucleic acid-binding protein
MNLYVDSSAVLQFVLGQPNALAFGPSEFTHVTSELTECECLRTLDRYRLRGVLTDSQVGERREAVFDMLRGMDVVTVSTSVLRRASQPYPTPLGSLDAIHLATALQWRDAGYARNITVATHDRELAAAARAMGLAVDGV